MKSDCSPCVSSMMRYFLGAYLLLAGVNMLLGYQGTIDFMMSASGRPALEGAGALFDGVAMAVAYSWPVVKTLIGLALLLNVKKCWAVTLLLAYLALFAVGHIMAGDMLGATFAFVVAFFASSMMAHCMANCDVKKK